jgi:hypothetical protein
LYEEASRSGQTILSTKRLAQELITTAFKNFPKLYIVVDGIDECDREERKEIASTFETIWESLPNDNIEPDSLRCLFISQDDGPSRKDFAKMVSMKINEDHIKKDLRAYANAWSIKIQTKFSLPEVKRKLAEDYVTSSAEG